MLILLMPRYLPKPRFACDNFDLKIQFKDGFFDIMTSRTYLSYSQAVSQFRLTGKFVFPEFSRSGFPLCSFYTLKVPYQCDNGMKLNFPVRSRADLSNGFGRFIVVRKFFL